ncbi:MAG: metallophosphoesterase [Aestuariivirga sp.]|uniref:metallophosphoesterase n=1 Tax=Aestuariivirga sp. TaxID=2650926 RepID=UPI00301A9487
MITRRQFLRVTGGLALAGTALAGYALIIEPGFLLFTRHYVVTPPRWTPGFKLRLVLLADPHLVEPHMPLSRWRGIIATANALDGDLVLMLGDYVAGHRWRSGTVKVTDMARAASALRAALGVFSVNGNHDWWDDMAARRAGHGPTLAERALADSGIPTLSNRAVRLAKDGLPFWLSGTDSALAIPKKGGFESRADLAGTLSQITDDAPIIHLAHEPDLFVNIPPRVSLTLSGHTHGGQVRLLGHSPMVPSAYGNRFAYGHVVEDGRHLIVSGGLGCSIMPVRFGMPPEITVVDLS